MRCRCRHGGGLYEGVAELFLHERLLTSAHRTTDAGEADFFFVPAWPSSTLNNVGRAAYLRRVVDYVRTTWGDWNRTDGRNHLFVMGVRPVHLGQGSGGAPISLYEPRGGLPCASFPDDGLTAVVLTECHGHVRPSVRQRAGHAAA